MIKIDDITRGTHTHTHNKNGHSLPPWVEQLKTRVHEFNAIEEGTQEFATRSMAEI